MGYSQHGSREVKSPFSNFPRAQSREKQKKKEKNLQEGFSPLFFFLSLLLSSFFSFLSLSKILYISQQQLLVDHCLRLTRRRPFPKNFRLKKLRHNRCQFGSRREKSLPLYTDDS